MQNTLALAVGLLLVASLVTAPVQAAEPHSTVMHRYMIERTFPAGALDGLDEAGKRQVNANNASLDVTWIHSYANADKTKTYCVYEGPSEAAVRKAADLNSIPVDEVVEIPLDLDPGPLPAMAQPAHRYIVERTFPPGALDGLDAEAKRQVNANNAEFGVRWIGSYATADLTRTYCVYEGPSAEAVRQAAAKNSIPVDQVTEVPVDLLP